MRLVVFEDKKFDQLYPVSLTRAVFELKTGITSLLDKINGNFPNDGISFFIRDYLVPTFKKRYPSDSVNDIKSIEGSDVLIVNGRCLFTGEGFKMPDGEMWVEKDGELVIAKISKKTVAEFKGNSIDELVEFAKTKAKKVITEIEMINYPWDLINHNPQAITDDFKKLKKTGIEGTIAKESVIYGPRDNVFIGKNTVVQPFVCIDTQHGPVMIDEGSEIHPYTRIEGPCYIGKGTIVLGAKIREGCSIGPVCRVGGEVEESIIHAYSNKYHDGFLGHAYVGEWINLGAMTTNSDLKNDYGNVSVIINGRMTDTGSTKVGCFIGDHTKTSIGTLINTGSNIGALCLILFSGQILPKYLPSGSWFIGNVVTKGFGLKKLLETAEYAMSRRKVKFTEEDRQLLEKVYDIAKADRETLINKAKFTGSK